MLLYIKKLGGFLIVFLIVLEIDGHIRLGLRRGKMREKQRLPFSYNTLLYSFDSFSKEPFPSLEITPKQTDFIC